MSNTYTRRAFVASTAAASLLAADYKRADASWFAKCPFGVSTHWTALSQTIHPADWRPFAETVANFNVNRFVDRIAGAGASYLILTSVHALQQMAAPCEALDRILPGRTTKRDLIGEIGRACKDRGMHFILYYNHSCNNGDDPAWEHAVGFYNPDKTRFVDNVIGIITEMGERYGKLVEGWWFDSCFALDGRGPYKPGVGILPTFQFPWERWTAAAKSGFPGRLVTLSSGMMTYYLYSDHQDYEWGEANDLVAVPAAQFTPDGLQAHRWICLDNPDWVHFRYNTSLAASRFRLDQLALYVKTAHRFSVPVTFNIDVDRNGELLPETLNLLAQLKQKIAKP